MDYDYLPVSDGNGDAALMHVTAPGRLIGSTVNPVDSIVNVPTKFIATQGRLNASGFIDPTTKQDFKGHLEGNTVVIDAFEPGSTDKGALEGDIIIIKPNTGWANRVATVIKNLTGFGTPQDITLGTATAATLTASGTVTADKFTPAGAVLLDGRTNATYRYTMLAGDHTAKFASFSFAHGLAYAPQVDGYFEFVVPSNPATEPRYQMPQMVGSATNMSYHVSIDSIDATNISVKIILVDAGALAQFPVGNVVPFIFYCTPRPT